jgi:hypothetical protein
VAAIMGGGQNEPTSASDSPQHGELATDNVASAAGDAEAASGSATGPADVSDSANPGSSDQEQ